MNCVPKHTKMKCATDSKNIFSQDFQKKSETFTQVSEYFGISKLMSIEDGLIIKGCQIIVPSTCVIMIQHSKKRPQIIVLEPGEQRLYLSTVQPRKKDVS